MALTYRTETEASITACCVFYLAIYWLLGLLCGIFLSLYAGFPFPSMMRRIMYDSVSIASLFVTGLIPFLFTVFAVFLSKPWLIYAICFCRACLYGFTSMHLSVAYDSAGWLIRSLTLFHNNVGCMLAILLWLRILSGRKRYWLALLVVYIVVGCISIYVISPFLACLIEF